MQMATQSLHHHHRKAEQGAAVPNSLLRLLAGRVGVVKQAGAVLLMQTLHCSSTLQQQNTQRAKATAPYQSVPTEGSAYRALAAPRMQTPGLLASASPGGLVPTAVMPATSSSLGLVAVLRARA